MEFFRDLITTLLSPTYVLAKTLKLKKTSNDRKKLINSFNTFYAYLSLLFVIIISIFLNDLANFIKGSILIFISYYCFSRVNEIFAAFLIDSQSKLKKEPSSSTLKYPERIRLAMVSYLELILDYSIIYFTSYRFFPNSIVNYNDVLKTIWDFVYFSGVSITTLGFGDILPSNPLIRILNLYEVINGILLVVVCFTVYVNLNFQEKRDDNKKTERPIKNSIIKLVTVVILIFSLSLVFSYFYKRSINTTGNSISRRISHKSHNASNSIHNILEMLYFLSGPGLCVLGIWGLKSLSLSKESITTIKEENQKTAKRESIKLAVEICDSFNKTTAKHVNRFMTSLRRVGINEYLGAVNYVNNNQFATVFGFPNVQLEAVSQDMIQALNALEIFAVYFNSGSADMNTGFSLYGPTYCRVIRNIVPVIAYIQENDPTNFADIVILYKEWSERLQRQGIII